MSYLPQSHQQKRSYLHDFYSEIPQLPTPITETHLNNTTHTTARGKLQDFAFAPHLPEDVGAMEGRSNSEIEGSVPSGFYFGVCYFT